MPDAIVVRISAKGVDAMVSPVRSSGAVIWIVVDNH
ncbi:hypothetical protein NPIL_322151, partial [Nephila pilipes]